MTQLAYFPAVEREEELIDVLSRAAWFLTFSPIDRIFVPIADAKLADLEWQVAAGMDPSISDRFDVLRERVEFVPVAEPDDMARILQQVSMVMRWRRDPTSEPPANDRSAQMLSGKRVIEVDPTTARYEGSYYIDISRELLPAPAQVIAESDVKLRDLGRRLGRFDRAYVLATGPSVSTYARFDYSRSLNIVCNTVILDDELMTTVQPHFLVFADPVFHFGPSEYAATFRASVLRAAAEYDFTICIPLKYYAVFSSALPELKERVIAIPYRKDREFNFDLVQDLELKTTSNVLTFLMLPLAATFADRIGILGCDGRPLNENTYFWKHGSSTQLSDKMANIRQVHPAFFDIAYNDYYLEHCQTLEAQLQEGERAGRRFECLGDSHIPALRDRAAENGGHRAPAAPERSTAGSPQPQASPNVIVIDPDALDWGGHFMAYNDKLAAALEEQGCSVKVLCNEQLDAEILRQRPHFVPRLTVHSWAMGNHFAGEVEIAQCENELTNGILELSGDEPVVAYMYTGTVEHAAILARLVERRPQLYGHVNLFYAAFHDHHWAEWVERYGRTLKQLREVGPRLRVTVPTEGIKARIADISGAVLEVAPHPSTAIADQDFAFAEPGEGASRRDAGSPDGQPEQFRVLFPGTPRGGKGFEHTLATVDRLARDASLRPVMRYYPHPRSTDPYESVVSKLPDNVEVVRGELDNDAFLDLFRPSHVSVLPYDRAAFANRTSGLLIDSLYHGLPVVALRGTWLAEVVERYGCGVVADEDTPDELTTAVYEVVDGYSTFVERARVAACSYFAGNSWRALAGSIVETSRAPAAPVRRPIAVPEILAGGNSAKEGTLERDGDHAVTSKPAPASVTGMSSTHLSPYDRLYLWASTRSPVALSAGRLAAWCGRTARRYPVLTAAYLALLIGLIVAAALSGGEFYAPILWGAAGVFAVAGALVVAMGFTGLLIKEARHELEMKQLSLRRRVEWTETTLREEQKAAEAFEAKMEALRSEREATTKALKAKIAELLNTQEQARESLLAEIGGLRSDQEEIADLEVEIGNLKSETEAISERALSVDIVSALRQVHPLWVGRDRVDQPDFAKQSEHGHVVVMALLVEEERKTPGVLRGKTLIEVGSTRERNPRQGSTEKLAIFTGMTDMRFITVDMDPINTERARRIIDLLNPNAEAITERGESYLATCSESLDYVYLDAFDFEHDQHSPERQARYREVLKTEIRDEACWEMHQLCAAAIITKMPEGGIVVIDDTWTDEAGDFDGKGRLAVPLLLATGFTVIAQAPRTVALKRAARQ